MKVKILTGSNIRKLEYKINTFIKDKCIINISHEIAVLKVRNKCVNCLIIIILYHEYNRCGYLNVNSIMNLKDNEII